LQTSSLHSAQVALMCVVILNYTFRAVKTDPSLVMVSIASCENKQQLACKQQRHLTLACKAGYARKVVSTLCTHCVVCCTARRLVDASTGGVYKLPAPVGHHTVLVQPLGRAAIADALAQLTAAK
jgi:hypothetical protein